jgi:hypothetical protein
MESMVFGSYKSILVSFGREGQLPEAVFDRWLRLLSEPGINGHLSAAVGPLALTLSQRSRAADISKKLGIRTAVVTDSRVGRGVVTAVSWLGADIKAFSWNHTSDAGLFLRLEEADEQKELNDVLWALRQQLLGEERLDKRIG